MKKTLTLTILTLVVFITNITKTSALSCLSTTIQENINSSEVIFSGKVLRIDESSREFATATFEVSEYWKGQVGQEITISGIYAWTGQFNPPAYFKVGENYLVFASKVQNNLIANIDCNRTTRLSEAEDLKKVLGKGKTPIEIKQTSTETITKPPVVVPTKGQTSSTISTTTINTSDEIETKNSWFGRFISWIRSLF